MLENTPLTLNHQLDEVVGEISVDSRIEACFKKGEQFVLSPTLQQQENGKMKVIGLTMIPIERSGLR